MPAHAPREMQVTETSRAAHSARSAPLGLTLNAARIGATQAGNTACPNPGLPETGTNAGDEASVRIR